MGADEFHLVSRIVGLVALKDEAREVSCDDNLCEAKTLSVWDARHGSWLEAQFFHTNIPVHGAVESFSKPDIERSRNNLHSEGFSDHFLKLRFPH